VLVTKLSNDELLAWALDHDTGAPLKGVNVRGNGPGLEPTEMLTDANGLAGYFEAEQRNLEVTDAVYTALGEDAARVRTAVQPLPVGSFST